MLGTILIFIYLAFTILIGIWASRRATPEGFLLGERKLGTLSTFATIAASKTGGGLFLTVVALTYIYGAGAIGYIFGLIAGFVVFYFFAKKRLKDEADENKYYTLADYVFHGYGKVAGYMAAGLTFLILCVNIMMQLIGGSKTIFEITGIGYVPSLLIISFVILFYLVIGGFKAVVKTDFVQYIAILITVIFVVFAFSSLGKINPDYLDLGEAGIVNILVFVVFGLIYPFFSAELYQRVYATKNKNTLKKSFTLSTAIYPVVAATIFFIGLIIRTHLPGVDPEVAFIRGLIDLLPAVFLGIGGVLMFSAIMSSADTYVFTNTSIILQDFVLRNKNLSKEKLVFYFRITMAVLVMVGVMFSFLLRSLVMSTYIWGSFGTVLAIGILATWMRRKISGMALSFGFSLGIITVIGFMLITSFDIKPAIMGYAVASTILGLLIGGVVAKVLKRNTLDTVGNL